MVKDHNKEWARQRQAWGAFVNERWAKHRLALPARTDGWKQKHDDSYYRTAIAKSQGLASAKAQESLSS